jgi:hypothetical protein
MTDNDKTPLLSPEGEEKRRETIASRERLGSEATGDRGERRENTTPLESAEGEEKPPLGEVWRGSKPSEESLRQELKATEQRARETLKKITANVHESDNTPVAALTLRKILGGDILSAEMVRHQIWLFILVVLFTIVYVAIRYQCQQDMIKIDRMEKELTDAKYKALSSSSILTEKCRESHVLEVLRANSDSLLQASERPPYIINVPE